MNLSEIKKRINPSCVEIPGTESYEREWLCDTIDSLTDILEQTRRENKAQLAELRAIDNALGTNEGHSAVYWIEQLKQQRDELLAELLRVKEICLPEVGIGIVNEVVIASMKKSK